MLKVLVEQGYDLVDPVPSTLFCLLEFDGQRLATSHNETRNGKVKFHEEAEFSIKKSGNLKIQLCSVDGKQGILSLTVSYKQCCLHQLPINACNFRNTNYMGEPNI